MLVLTLIALRTNRLTSLAAIQATVQQAGFWAPTLFVGLQIIQVFFPIIPGGLSTIAAVAIFGPVWGFIYNYVGIGLGSIAAFSLVRRFGKSFLEDLVPAKTLAKSQHYLNGGNFDRMFTIAILLPVVPDDLLCMLAGLTKMSLKKFVTIIVLCKPWTILAYSLGMNSIFQLIPRLWAK
ncbi:hypothetical protein FC75_GL002339 [Lacticaseibacillus camelliae DSM 22697 = JCM 13995]|uniref:TVP38/TMEM64 family membrane protein n=2 Tax=Lacticaseibacillus camelliae TaxID=381742 RepID=A0A0R2EYT0_9LACO|nr:hypothetical protein FC75_GL002339 [Lacticaseibacillus camelliae DSM 22697 = JCM 13995]